MQLAIIKLKTPIIIIRKTGVKNIYPFDCKISCSKEIGIEIEIYAKNSIPILYKREGTIKNANETVIHTSYLKNVETRHTIYAVASIIKNLKT